MSLSGKMTILQLAMMIRSAERQREKEREREREWLSGRTFGIIWLVEVRCGGLYYRLWNDCNLLNITVNGDI